MLNSGTWPQRTGGGDCNGCTFKCCKPLFELNVTGIVVPAATGTRGGKALKEAVQEQSDLT